MITGTHLMAFASDADAARAFFRDVLGFESVDAGGGWLIFALPPAEVGFHPDDNGGRQELYLVCDDVDATGAGLTAKGGEFESGVSAGGWGRLTPVGGAGMGGVGLGEPRHPL